VHPLKAVTNLGAPSSINPAHCPVSDII